MPSFPSSIRTRELRLLSGLVMGLFILCHFANHALGLVSLAAMEDARPLLAGLWRTKPGTVLLYGAVAVHFALTLRTLYIRRMLRMSAKEAGQTVLGLILPFLLIGHVAGTRLEFALTGREPAYPAVMHSLWVVAPLNGWKQAIALLIAWTHFCLGLYFWLRPKAWARKGRHALFALAMLFPVVSLLGFTQAGKEITRRASEIPLPVAGGGRPGWADPAMQLAFVLPIVLVLAGRGVRAVRARRHQIRIGYPGGRFVDVPKGFSILEASRRGRIPHQAVCGGRARCSTCRVEVVRGLHAQPLPGEGERATLKRIGAGPRIRLACQLRPVRAIEVVPVLSVSETANALDETPRAVSYGRECEVAVLFCDLRSFTSFTERSLPFDVVFILNRFFEMVGKTVAESGGRVDKFIGDGAMVLFGLETTPEEASRQAMDAARRIRKGLEALNADYAAELREPLRIVVAIHQGPAIVGDVGHGNARSLTAVGDTINVASRLEGLAKASNSELVVSDDVARLAGAELVGFEVETLPIRGRSQPLKVWLKRPTE